MESWGAALQSRRWQEVAGEPLRSRGQKLQSKPDMGGRGQTAQRLRSHSGGGTAGEAAELGLCPSTPPPLAEPESQGPITSPKLSIPKTPKQTLEAHPASSP